MKAIYFILTIALIFMTTVFPQEKTAKDYLDSFLKTYIPNSHPKDSLNDKYSSKSSLENPAQELTYFKVDTVIITYLNGRTEVHKIQKPHVSPIVFNWKEGYIKHSDNDIIYFNNPDSVFYNSKMSSKNSFCVGTLAYSKKNNTKYIINIRLSLVDKNIERVELFEAFKDWLEEDIQGELTTEDRDTYFSNIEYIGHIKNNPKKK